VTHTGRAGSSVGAGRTHSGWGYPLVALVPPALGVVSLLSFVLVGHAVEQLLLALSVWRRSTAELGGQASPLGNAGPPGAGG
jgi:hypothetical protein